MSRRSFTMTSGVVVALCAAACGCASPRTAAPSGWFGNVYLAGQEGAFDATKSFIVTWRFSDAGVQMVDATIAYGSPPRLPDGGRDYLLELVDAGGRTLSRHTAPDPRVAIVEKEGSVRLAEGLLTARLAFDPAGRALRLSDASGNKLAEVALAGAIGEFCRRQPRDADCRTSDGTGQSGP